MTKKTPLYQTHVDLQAKMVDFAGYDMPVQYTSIKEEHAAVRNNMGLFDVSHMGEFRVEGPEALRFLQSVTTNDLSTIVIGQAQYSCIPNDAGGIVDDLIIYRLAEAAYLLVVNASNIEKDYNWIAARNQYDATLTNVSDQYGLLALQGPNALAFIDGLSDLDLSGLAYYHFRVGDLFGLSDIIISATGYTGSGGVELYIPSDSLVGVWNHLLEEGKAHGLSPVGLGARDTLRLEMGYCLYGNDIDDTTSPIDAGLSWITKLSKTENFPSKDLFITQKEAGVKRRLCAIQVEDRRVPRHGYQIFSEDSQLIGQVTSGTLSPTLEVPIGLGYIDAPYHKKGTAVLIDTGRKKLKAQVVKAPFVKVN